MALFLGWTQKILEKVEFVWNTQPAAATNRRGCSRKRVIALWSKHQRQDDPEVTQGDKIYRLEAAIIDERKLSLAIANSGFMYQDIAPSNYWKIHGTAGPTGDFSSDYLGMLFLIISSVCRHVDGVFSKKKKKIFMITQIISVMIHSK